MSMWEHQEQAISYMQGRNNAMLMMGVATGKTRTVLEFITRRNFNNVLIVGTKNSLDVWRKQNIQFNYNLTLGIPQGTVIQKAKQIRDNFTKDTTQYTTIAVISYETIQRKYMVEMLEKLQIDCIIFDEVHRLRGHSTRQSKAAYQIAKSHPKAYRIGLTGTLIYNKPLDVFGIYRFVDPSLFGIRWNQFRFHYALWAGERGFIPIKYLNQDELHEKISNNAFIVDREQVLDLPSEQHILLDAEFTEVQRLEYNRFNKQYLMNLSKDKTVVAHNILDKVNKMQQLTSGFVYQDSKAEHFSSAKADLLRETLEEINETVVIFYKFKEDLEIATKAITELGKSLYRINGAISEYEAWLQDQTNSVLMVQIQSGSEGIDFTKSKIVIFYDLPYSWGQYHQALGRTSRPNQVSDHVLYYYLMIKNSIDYKIWNILQTKGDIIEELLSEFDTVTTSIE